MAERFVVVACAFTVLDFRTVWCFGIIVVVKYWPACILLGCGKRSCTKLIASDLFEPLLPLSLRKRTSATNIWFSVDNREFLPTNFPVSRRLSTLAREYFWKVLYGIPITPAKHYMLLSSPLIASACPHLLSHSMIAFSRLYLAYPCP